MSTVSKATVQALLNRGRTRMVEALVYEGGLADPAHVHAHWRGFATCAALLLNGKAELMALHDAGNPQGPIEATFARFPADLERLTLADMKKLMWSQGIEFASDLITDRDVKAVEQLENGVNTIFPKDDEHSVSTVDVGNGGVAHSSSRLDTAIVAQGGAA